MTQPVEAVEAPPVEAVQVNLRADLDAALAALTPKAKQWLLSLPQHNWQGSTAAIKLGFSTHTVFKWKRDPRVAYARQLLEQVELEEYAITKRYVIQAHKRIVEGDPRRAFNKNGTAKNISKLDDDTAFAVAEYSFNAKGKPRVRMHSKDASLKTLERMVGLGEVQKHEHTGKDGLPLMPQEVDPIDLAKRVAFILAQALHANGESTLTKP